MPAKQKSCVTRFTLGQEICDQFDFQCLLGPKRASLALLDHLVGPREQRRGHGEADRLGRLKFDQQMVLCRLLALELARLI
jgi:hypothetical protein